MRRILISVLLLFLVCCSNGSKMKESHPNQENASSEFSQADQKKLDTALSVNLTSLGFDNQSGNITSILRITNQGRKSIKAFEGILTYVDIFNNDICSIALTYENPIPEGESIVWNGGFSSFSEQAKPCQPLLNKKSENVKVRLFARKILFADGEILTRPFLP